MKPLKIYSHYGQCTFILGSVQENISIGTKKGVGSFIDSSLDSPRFQNENLPFSEITDDSQSMSSSLKQKLVFTDRDRKVVVNNEGSGGGAVEDFKGAWAIYDTSNNLVSRDWSSMINRSLRNLNERRDRVEHTEYQECLKYLFKNGFAFIFQNIKS